MKEFSEENSKKRFEDDLILRKSLLKGHTTKIAKDNIKLRANSRKLAMNVLKNSRGNN